MKRKSAYRFHSAEGKGFGDFYTILRRKTDLFPSPFSCIGAWSVHFLFWLQKLQELLLQELLNLAVQLLLRMPFDWFSKRTSDYPIQSQPNERGPECIKQATVLPTKFRLRFLQGSGPAPTSFRDAEGADDSLWASAVDSSRFFLLMGKLETTSSAFFWQPWVCRDMIQLLCF